MEHPAGAGALHPVVLACLHAFPRLCQPNRRLPARCQRACAPLPSAGRAWIGAAVGVGKAALWRTHRLGLGNAQWPHFEKIGRVHASVSGAGELDWDTCLKLWRWTPLLLTAWALPLSCLAGQSVGAPKLRVWCKPTVDLGPPSSDATCVGTATACRLRAAAGRACRLPPICLQLGACNNKHRNVHTHSRIGEERTVRGSLHSALRLVQAGQQLGLLLPPKRLDECRQLGTRKHLFHAVLREAHPVVGDAPLRNRVEVPKGSTRVVAGPNGLGSREAGLQRWPASFFSAAPRPGRAPRCTCSPLSAPPSHLFQHSPQTATPVHPLHHCTKPHHPGPLQHSTKRHNTLCWQHPPP